MSGTLDVRMFTVGPVQENCFIVRRPEADSAVIVDPGEEAERLLEALEALGIETLEAILLTHTHFDHVGAVAPVARATGAPVYCPELEQAGAGEHHGLRAVAGVRAVRELRRRSPAGRRRDADAGRHRRSRSCSPRATARAISPTPTDGALFSGDVLFQGSVGRVDLPGGDWPTLLASIGTLVERFPERDDRVPGPHGPHDARARAAVESVPGRARHPVSRAARRMIQAPKGTFDVLPADGDAPRGARDSRPGASSAPPATAGSRRRRSRPPSCSPAGSARRPTSCRRRCTASTTAAGAR